MRPAYRGIVFIFFLAVAMAGCGRGQAASDPPATGRRDTPVPVATAAVVRKTVPLDIQSIGTVEAFSTVAIHSQVTGQLTAVRFREGDDVSTGQPLFALDQRPLEAALQQSQSNLERDLAQLDNAKAQAARYQDLAKRGIATREQVDQLNASSAALAATVGADRAAVNNAQIQLQYATITAPISGRTGALMVHAGNLVRANDTTPLVVIEQVSPIYVSFTIPETELSALRRYMANGSPSLSAEPPGADATPANGHITFVDNAVDPTTGTIRLKGEFPNADRALWPGQFVDVDVTLATESDAIVVPAEAVEDGPQGTYVFVAKPDETVDLRLVTVERTHGDEVVIAKGLAAGETVVTDGQIRLTPGSHISAKNPAPPSASS